MCLNSRQYLYRLHTCITAIPRKQLRASLALLWSGYFLHISQNAPTRSMVDSACKTWTQIMKAVSLCMLKSHVIKNLIHVILISFFNHLIITLPETLLKAFMLDPVYFKCLYYWCMFFFQILSRNYNKTLVLYDSFVLFNLCKMNMKWVNLYNNRHQILDKTKSLI